MKHRPLDSQESSDVPTRFQPQPRRWWLGLFMVVLAIIGVVTWILSWEETTKSGERTSPSTAADREDREHSSHHHVRQSPIDTVPFDAPDQGVPPPSDHAYTGIEGVVVDAVSGQPVEGAIVHPVIWMRNPDQCETTDMLNIGEVVADSEGRFRIKAVQGTYVIRAFNRQSEPHRYGVSEAFPLKWNETQRVNVQIGGQLNLSGSVCDESGEGMPNVEIAIVPSFNASDPIYVRTTDSDGRFAVAGMKGPTSSATIIGGLKGKLSDPAGPLIQDTTLPFTFVAKLPEPPRALIKKVVLSYGGPEVRDVVYRLLADGVPLHSERPLPVLSPGDVVIDTGGIHNPGGNLQLELEQQSSAYLLADLREEESVLKGASSDWHIGQDIQGRVTGLDGDNAWVLLLAQQPPTHRVRWARVLKDGSFTLKNVPDRDGLYVALQLNNEYILLGESFAKPLETPLVLSLNR